MQGKACMSICFKIEYIVYSEVDSAKKNLFQDDDAVFENEKYPPVKVLHHKQGSWTEIITQDEFNNCQIHDSPSETLVPSLPKVDLKTKSVRTEPDSGDLIKRGGSPGTRRIGDQLKDTKDENQSAISTSVIQGEQMETVSDLEGSGEGSVRSRKLPTPTDPELESYTQFDEKNHMYRSISSYTSEEIHHDDEGLIAQKPDIHFDEKTEDNEFERGLIAVCIGEIL